MRKTRTGEMDQTVQGIGIPPVRCSDAKSNSRRESFTADGVQAV